MGFCPSESFEHMIFDARIESHPHATIAVALSGGIDSSVACALLKSHGFKVVALTMTFSGHSRSDPAHQLSCFGSKEPVLLERAKAVASRLGVEHHVISVTEEYQREVLAYVRREYLSGRTPNPCVQCNAKVKLGVLLTRARQSGVRFDYVATGHYARAVWDPNRKRFALLRATDPIKDQSYFLSMISQDQLLQLLLPLGNLTKQEVRDTARDLGLGDLIAEEESQDFFRESTYRVLLNSCPGITPGPIVDTHGNVLGTHCGLAYYTIGQRRGLGLGGSGEPWYVVRLDVKENRLVVGRRSEVFARGLRTSTAHWISWPEAPAPTFRASCRIRASHEPAPASVRVLGRNGLEVRFDQPQFAVTPGQIAALYDGETLIGGGVITDSIRD